MRVAICWAEISGYMAACWRELAARPGIELTVLSIIPGQAANVDFRNERLFEGIPGRLITHGDAADADRVAALVAPHRPEVVVICGWNMPGYTAMVDRPEFAGARFVMGMDTPRQDTIRQKLGRFVKGRYFKKIDLVMVAGERTWQLARLLGFAESRIRRGVYAIDYAALERILARRAAAGPWPRRFVFVGRYVEQKSIDWMTAAYRQYRELASEPWELWCCGQGPDGELIRATPGARDLGFKQPEELPVVLAECGAFVLASRWEPWGAVLAEAAAAGLPVICTEACSAHLDVVRDCYNGLVVPTGDVPALARAMRWMHDRSPAELAAMGERSRQYAAAFSAAAWADRWVHAFREIVAEPNDGR